jgi:hypothetical protein
MQHCSTQSHALLQQITRRLVAHQVVQHVADLFARQVAEAVRQIDKRWRNSAAVVPSWVFSYALRFMAEVGHWSVLDALFVSPIVQSASFFPDGDIYHAAERGYPGWALFHYTTAAFEGDRNS